MSKKRTSAISCGSLPRYWTGKIEAYASESNVGADAWRCTGVHVLTFGGNIKIQEKVMYGRIQQHLQQKYQHKFSYSTVVQLCLAWNKCRKSAKNYKGVCKSLLERPGKGLS